MAHDLDNQAHRNQDPALFIEPLDEPGDEVGIRVPLEGYIFPLTNKLAARLGLAFRYKHNGSGRGFSFSDLLILDSSQGQPAGARKMLSQRVFGNGGAKGVSLAGYTSLDELLRDDSVKQVIQQLYGDMILDETKYGFITEYNSTVFFRRVVGTQTLECSPVVRVNEAPIEKFLFVLHQAEMDKNMKPDFSRTVVKDTSPGDYHVLQKFAMSEGFSVKRSFEFVTNSRDITQSKPKRRLVYNPQGIVRVDVIDNMVDVTDNMVDNFELAINKLPTIDMEELGVTGAVIGFGKYGNVIEGKAPDGTKLALKLFDLRANEAWDAAFQEFRVYRRLKPLQGLHVPRLIALGRIAHTSIISLVLTDEAGSDVVKELQGRQGMLVRRKIVQALSEIHNLMVLHNDVKLSNILWSGGDAKFIDFDASILNPDMFPYKRLEEIQSLENQLDEEFDDKDLKLLNLLLQAESLDRITVKNSALLSSSSTPDKWKLN
ncbi:hypothetical protein SELMODRAFT_418936 [Selaginella moellendorffii]|uniref:Protein kinase domain-containing protein n=1 Tax=Selaginella moellendorffii TaxID=88036 RepID=D8S7A1_SELML|nr:hypothetical protein SELMODRAFT_418936 [Selaginella moellendorffii]